VTASEESTHRCTDVMLIPRAEDAGRGLAGSIR
jgi:hypothetical protein